MQYCSLQHQTLLLSPVTSTTGYWFCFGSIPSFFLELFLHWSLVAFWVPTDLGSSFFSILSFFLFILFMGFSRQNTEVVCIPFSSGPHSVRPLHHDPSVLRGPTRHGFVHWVKQAVFRVIRLASFLWLWFQCVCPLMPSRNTYHLTWVSLTLDEGYLLTALWAIEQQDGRRLRFRDVLNSRKYHKD